MAMVSMSAELRRKAEQVRSDAERIDASKIRAEMLEIAAKFELLAKRTRSSVGVEHCRSGKRAKRGYVHWQH
jgi:hypothetical protein